MNFFKLLKYICFICLIPWLYIINLIILADFIVTGEINGCFILEIKNYKTEIIYLLIHIHFIPIIIEFLLIKLLHNKEPFKNLLLLIFKYPPNFYQTIIIAILFPAMWVTIASLLDLNQTKYQIYLLLSIIANPTFHIMTIYKITGFLNCNNK